MQDTLTQTLIKELPVVPVGKKHIRIFDKNNPKFYLEIGRRTASFYVIVRDPRGRRRSIHIGRVGEITLSQAISKAGDLQAQCRLSGDPAGDRDRFRAIPSLKTFIEERYMPYIQQETRSHLNAVAYTRRIIALFGRKTLDELQVNDVQAFKASLVKKGLANSTVNLHLATLRRIYNLAAKWQVWNGPNPTSSTGMLPVRNREAHLSDAETGVLLSVLRSMPDNDAMTAILILALTGARRDEILHARWENLDLSRGVLTVPLSKSGKPRYIFLPLEVVKILETHRQGRSGAYPHVFPSRKTDGPIQDIKRSWSKAKKLAGLPEDFRLHDLRHNFASSLVNNGVGLSEVGALLGHSDPRITMRYAHFAPQRLIETASIASIGWGLGTNGTATRETP